MSLKLRVILAVLILVGVVVKILPNFVNMEGKWWPAQGKIVYGLDIKGGLHLVMGIDVDSVLRERLTRLTKTIGDELTAANIKYKSVAVGDEKALELKIELESAANEGKVRELIEQNHARFLQVLSSSGTEIVAKIYENQITEIRHQVLDQAINVIRNRIDEFGVSEPTIAAQGDNRVLVQLAGVDEATAARAKELIKSTRRRIWNSASSVMNSAPRRVRTRRSWKR
jgi:preprotein translocase subunit SecD